MFYSIVSIAWEVEKPDGLLSFLCLLKVDPRFRTQLTVHFQLNLIAYSSEPQWSWLSYH